MRSLLLAALVPGTMALAVPVMAASPLMPSPAAPSAVHRIADTQTTTSTTDRARQLEAEKNRARTLESGQNTTAETQRARELEQTKDRARTLENTQGTSTTETDRARALEATRDRARTLENNKTP